MVDKTNYKSHLRFFVMCVLCVLGVISGVGSLNFGVTSGWLYRLAGLVGIYAAVHLIVMEYKLFRKNTD